MVQVSRLGNPLINEVVIPLGQKDFWNRSEPEDDSQFDGALHRRPRFAHLENLLYGRLVGHRGRARDRRDRAHRSRRDPAHGRAGPELHRPDEVRPAAAEHGVKPGVNGACPGGTASAAAPDRLAVLNADLGGFPNGRRLDDDVVDIELRAFAQGYGTFLNGASGCRTRARTTSLGDGVDANDVPFSNTFPYVAAPHQGYEVP